MGNVLRPAAWADREAAELLETLREHSTAIWDQHPKNPYRDRFTEIRTRRKGNPDAA
jgi:hypothetical protein